MKVALHLRKTCLCLAATALLSCPSFLRAQIFTLDWDVIAGGGGMSSAGTYSLIDTIGQPEVGFSEIGGLQWESGFLIGLNLFGPEAQSVTWTGQEDVLLFGQLTGSDQDGDTLKFVLVTPPAHGTLAFEATGACYYIPPPNFTGPDTFTFKASDGELESAPVAANIIINPGNDPPVLSVTSDNQTVQYSDPITAVTITAADVDSPLTTLSVATAWQKDGGDLTAGLPAGLTITADTIIGQTRSWTISGVPNCPPGTYVIRVTVTDDQSGTATTDLTLLVRPEDARATYTGAMFASTKSTSSGAATITLSATIQDITAIPEDPAWDSTPGDIRLATVTFINRENNSVIAANLPVGWVSANEHVTGTATYNWSVNIGNADSDSFTVGIIVNHCYHRNSSLDDTVITVSKPLTSDFVTGGGYLLMLRPSGMYAGDLGSKVNFGLNVKYNRAGRNLLGGIRMIVRRENLIYKIKGNAITSLSIDQNRATFNGRASIEDVTDPDFPIEIDGNATLQVKMTDNGEPGSADSLAVTIWNMTGGLWFASHWDDVETLEQTIGGGNLVVRSSRYLPKTGISGSEFSPRHPPIPLSIVLLSAPCRFLIQFPVLPEVDYAIEHSRDLIVWTHLTTVMSFTNEVLFFDTPDAVGAGQYYRVRPSR